MFTAWVTMMPSPPVPTPGWSTDSARRLYCCRAVPDAWQGIAPPVLPLLRGMACWAQVPEHIPGYLFMTP